jgi:hypothetical protein
LSIGPDAVTKQFVPITFNVSRNAIEFLSAENTSGPNGYWESLPSCANSGPFLSNGLNTLQQLPAGVSSTLQQQP